MSVGLPASFRGICRTLGRRYNFADPRGESEKSRWQEFLASLTESPNDISCWSSQDDKQLTTAPTEAHDRITYRFFIPCMSRLSHIKSQAQALPPEILSIIFKSVFEQIISVYSEDLRDEDDEPHIPSHIFYSGDNKNIVLIDKDLRSQSLFPYAFHSVCTAWRDVMESIPLFWTRLVFFVGKEQTPLLEVRQSLQRSHDLFIDVYIRRKERDITDYLDRVDDHHQERAYIQELMPLLNTHLDRIKMMSFDLICGSSILRLLEDVRNDTCPHLEFLSLDCICDDGHETRPNLQMNPEDLVSVSLVRPSILELCMNGQVLSLLLSHLGSLDVELETLRVLSWSTLREEEPVDLLSFIEDFISKTRPLRLELDTIPFVWDPDEVEEMITMYQAYFIDLTLRNLPEGATDVIFRLIDRQDDDDDDDDDEDEGLSTITISQCSLSAPNFLFRCQELYLTDIELPCDLAGFTSCWWGSILEIENCPEYAIDMMLDAMAQLHSGFDWFNAPELEQLSLIDCGDFSMAKLRHLWEVRDIASQLTLDITVIGHGPVLSLSDRQWIEEHPEHLHFDCYDIETDCD